MNAHSSLIFSSHGHAFTPALTLDQLQARAPAVFATAAHERMSPHYTFIPTQQVLSGLMQAGFQPVDARQARARHGSDLHTRHVVRLRRRFETVQLRDAVPEVIFLNSHDGTSAYQLRVGIFRVVCTNGLIVSRGAFPAYSVAHRGNVVDDVIAAALQVSERFAGLAEQVERMEGRRLLMDDQIRFAEQALALRYPEGGSAGMSASQLLTCRRVEDAPQDLWSTLNKVQENLLQGGLSRRAMSGRLIRTRRITSIREDVRINSGLWDIATQFLAA